MGKLLKTAFSILLVISCYSCQRNSDHVSAADIRNKLRKSRDFNLFLSLNSHLSKGVKSGRYSYYNSNKDYIKNHIPKGVSIDKISTKQLCLVYEKAGITDVDDYVKTEVALAKVYRELFKKFPELVTMSAIDRISLFKAVRSTENKGSSFKI